MRVTDRPRPIAPSDVYLPPDGFIEVGSNMWAPSGWIPGPYELPTPRVETDIEAAQEYARCRQSAAYFLLRFAWSVHVDDPSGEPQWRKFPAYPYLVQFFQDAQPVAHTLTEKSRQMLMSWAWMGIFLWDINFHDNWNNLLISRREIEVDDGGAQATHNSLIGKVRHMHLSLPPYLQQPLEFQYGMVRHVEANSFIRGETGTTKAGRGAVVKRAFVDEAAFIEHSPTVFASVRSVAKSGTILNSTANGKDNEFARIRFSATTTFRKMSFKWYDHPEKAVGLYCGSCAWVSDPTDPAMLGDQFRAHGCTGLQADRPVPPEARSPWYDAMARDLTPEQMASEIDISYERSTKGRVWPFFDAIRHTFDHTLVTDAQGRQVGPPDPTETLDAYRRRYLLAVIDRDRPCLVGWDFGVSDPTSLVLGQVIDERHMTIRWIDEFERSEESWDFFHRFVMGLWAPIVKQASGLDLLHYGDPSGRGRAADLTSWISNLANFAVPTQRIVMITGPKVGSRLDWIDFVGNQIRQDRCEVSTWCTHLIQALLYYRWPTDPHTGEVIPGAHEPVHDIWSHAASAFRYVYQFRWHNRLKAVTSPASQPSKVLRMGKGTRTGSARATDGRG